MKTDRRKDIGELFRQGEPIDRAVRMAARDALALHKRMDQPMPVCRDVPIPLKVNVHSG